VASDVADRVAQEIADWLDLRSTQVAGAILESVYRPRVVEPTRAKAAEYYARVLLNPDGSLNEAGKQQIIQQTGAQGYEAVAKTVAAWLTDQRDEAFAAARAEAVAGINGEGVTPSQP
jgi:hypothetical protein